MKTTLIIGNVFLTLAAVVGGFFAGRLIREEPKQLPPVAEKNAVVDDSKVAEAEVKLKAANDEIAATKKTVNELTASNRDLSRRLDACARELERIREDDNTAENARLLRFNLLDAAQQAFAKSCISRLEENLEKGTKPDSMCMNEAFKWRPKLVLKVARREATNDPEMKKFLKDE